MMTKTWILVADAHRARCFEQDASNTPLNELADFVHPHAHMTSETSADRTGDAGKGHGRTGHAGTQFEPKTEAGAKERNSFARQLADFLNKGVAEQRCSSLALIASSPMLGELRPLLSQAADKILHRSVAADLTHYQGAELKQRVHEALSPPG
jgi:protein required for attachment to host cells